MTGIASLEHVMAVKRDARQPRLADARRPRVPIARNQLPERDTRALWEAHDQCASGLPSKRLSGGASLLDLKIELARRNLSGCDLCERLCGADRLAGERGACGAGAGIRCFQQAVLVGEEPFLVPSHELFFTGCNLRCRYCYAWEHVTDAANGETVTTDAFREWTQRACECGCDHVNLIGGEPTVNLHGILRLLRALPEGMFVVWNTNMTASIESMRLLDGVVDLYLGDCRAGNHECAERLTGFPDVFDVAFRNFHLATEQASLVIRHLLVPGHVECCFEPIARRAAEELPGAAFHLMFQYTPHWEARRTRGLDRALTREERAQATRIAHGYGLQLVERPGAPSTMLLDTTGPALASEFETEIAILPDGKVSFRQLSAELAQVARTLEGAGGECMRGDAQ